MIGRPRAVGAEAARRAASPDDVPRAPRATPRERIAIAVVLLLCLTSGIGTVSYGFTHAGRLAGAGLIGGAPGGPPTEAADAAGSGSSATPRSTAQASQESRTSQKSAKSDKSDKSDKSEKSRKVVIPASAPRAYARNTAAAKADGRSGRVITFDVSVQKGLPYDADEIARAISATLNDPRSWRADDRQRFRLVPAGGDAELHAYLVTPATTDRLCAPLLTRGEVSCQQGDTVVLNARRWAYAVPDFRGKLPLYRQYLVNHEFGHYLGYGHVGCPGRGRTAPVMMQQTKGLNGCKANAWPYPNR